MLLACAGRNKLKSEYEKKIPGMHIRNTLTHYDTLLQTVDI